MSLYLRSPGRSSVATTFWASHFYLAAVLVRLSVPTLLLRAKRGSAGIVAEWIASKSAGFRSKQEVRELRKTRLALRATARA